MTDITVGMTSDSKTLTEAAPRLLVTGSRDWTDRDVIAGALSGWLTVNGYAGNTDQALPQPILVVGACLTGADLIAEGLWRSWGLPVERHPADWKRLGRSAGPTRNQEMVDSGVDACIGFPRGASHGTRGCMAKAKAAGVPVTVFEATA